MSCVFVFFIKILAFYLIYIGSVRSDGPIVNTAQGIVRGVVADDGDYSMFLGIPYAKVNDSNPFGPALPREQFDGIFEANDDSAICPQKEEFNNTLVGTLDCLHLNIHVPSSASSINLLPVFVWIYGGSFELGFYGRFLYGPKFLVRHDIVVITLNYRLGPYGFMCLDAPEVSGNQGLKDLVMGLSWIRENIAAFGGDPDQVTLAGNSAGSVAVEYLLLRKNDGPQLFHKAILQSGTVFYSSDALPSQDPPIQLAQHLGFETTDVKEALNFLAQTDPLVIIQANLDLNLAFGPCIENQFDGVEAFLTQNSVTVTEVPGVKDMPIIIGFNNDEMYAAAVGGDVLYPELILSYIMSLFFDQTSPDFPFMVDIVKTFYFGDGNDGQSFADFMGDIMFTYPAHRSLERFLNNDAGNVFLYMFSYAGERNFVKHRDNITGGGALHADELGYLFDISYMDVPSPEDQLVVDIMTEMWSNFVKYGYPTPQTSELLPYKWEPITKTSPYHYMDISSELRTGNRPLQDRMAFWELFYDGFGHLQKRNKIDRGNEAYKILNKRVLY